MSIALLPFLLLKPSLPLTGTYKAAYLKPGHKGTTEPPAGTPLGALPQAVIEGDRWMLIGMIVGFDGPLKVLGRAVTFIAEYNPAGKAEKPDRRVFDASLDGQTLLMRSRGPKEVRLVPT